MLNASGITDLLNEVFVGELAHILCTTNSQKLKQCNECNKFFIAKVNRSDCKFCSNKCKSECHNRQRKESGKHADYMREKRPYKENWW